MKFEFYKYLHDDAIEIRQKVFVEEQGFANEFDDIDQRAIHLVVYENNQAIGCARIFDEDKTMIFGRLAVLKEKRHVHIGSQILSALERYAQELGYQEVVLSAQTQALSFYVKNGYEAYGEEYLDEFCPHVHMRKRI